VTPVAGGHATPAGSDPPSPFHSNLLRLPAEHAATLREGAAWVNYPRNKVLMMDGEPAKHVLLLARGVVKITAESAAGTPKLLAFRGRGQLVGEFGCIDGSARSGTVRVIKPVGAWRISRDRFLHNLRADAPLCFSVLASVVARVRESDESVGEYGTYSSGDRVIRQLARLAVACLDEEGAATVAVPVGQVELAGSAGVVRETVSRTIKILAERGIAKARRGSIDVLDVNALVRSAQGTVPRDTTDP